jgi:hypothetical protein
MMTTKLNKAMPNSTLLNFGRVSTLIRLDNQLSLVNILPNFDRAIPKTFTTIHYSLF